MQTEDMNAPRLTIRLATSADKAPVLDFCATTWSHGDYVGAVWDDWLADPDSALLVGTLDGQPVALAHVQVTHDTVASAGWFEGLRVAPAQRGRGFGRQMLERSILEARQRGVTVLRLLTNHANVVMPVLLPRLGFVLCYTTTWYVARATDASLAPLETVAAVPAMPDPIQAPLLRATGGLYAEGWGFAAFTSERLHAHVAAGEVVCVPGCDGWAILKHDGETRRPALELVVGDVVGLMRGLRAHPLVQEHGEIAALLPIDSEAARLAQAAGYTAESYHLGVYALDLT
jgi:GNAT superfamily N-acetyltransferase